MIGPLEITVMEILWANGESNVHDVVQRLERPLAYTTVMTTLDRLYKKGLLDRRKEDRAFFYAPRFTKAEWERKRAGDMLAAFLRGAETLGRPADFLPGGCRGTAGRRASRRTGAADPRETA